MNGFDPQDVRATKILRIPREVEGFYKARSGEQKRPWPWYPYGRSFFEKLGAEFRTINNQQEMLLCEVVYNVYEFRPGSMYRARTIGFTAIEELENLPGIDHKYDDEEYLAPSGNTFDYGFGNVLGALSAH